VRLTDDDRLVGDSTDGEGFRRALVEAGHDPEGQPVVVIGAGGAARAVVQRLGRAGCAVTVVARRAEAAATAAALAPGGRAAGFDDLPAALDGAAFVVQATPVGMAGDLTVPFDPGLLRPGQVVADLVYHPLETPLLRAAAARGAHAVDGLGMLVHQAALQVEGWTGGEAPLEVMRAAARRALGEEAGGSRS
jgi:shikimate dehydrogenase